jgi:hypothetical protein
MCGRLVLCMVTGVFRRLNLSQPADEQYTGYKRD